MNSAALVVIVIAGSALSSALLLVIFGLFLRTHFSRLLRESERRIYRQLNDESGLRPRLEKLERENARLVETRAELEKQKRAAFALTQVARGLTQTSIQNLERVRELERRVNDSRATEP